MSQASLFARQYREAPCVFFDCDGVIFDSNGFKRRALRSVLSQYSAQSIDAMDRFWTANGGMSRHRKFRHFFEHIAPASDATERVRATVEQFGELSRRAFETAEPVREALILARDAGRDRSFVVSGADQAELRDIFTRKELSRLFAEVCGSPTPKLDHVERILRQRACPPNRALFIGDGGGDFEVCRTLGVPFIYLDQFSEWRDAKSALMDAAATLWTESWPELLSLLDVPNERAGRDAK